MTTLRSATGAVCFAIDVTQDGTYTVEFVDNNNDTGATIYTKDIAQVIAFLADKTKQGFNYD